MTSPPPPRRKREKTSVADARSRSPSPIRTPNSQKAAREPRRNLKSRDFDIDDIVVPYTGGGAISVVHAKEIFTPTWRMRDDHIHNLIFIYLLFILFYF